MINDNDMKEKLAKFYMNSKREVHIKTTSKRFYNGRIISVEYDFLVLIDRVLGEMPLFHKEIISIEPTKDGGVLGGHK